MKGRQIMGYLRTEKKKKENKRDKKHQRDEQELKKNCRGHEKK